MTIADFKVGDVVALKTGGPPMTVCEIVHEAYVPYVCCEWFMKSADGIWSSLQEADFVPSQLVMVQW